MRALSCQHIASLGLALLLMGCGQSSEGGKIDAACVTGEVRCACHPNGTCNGNLICLSEVCVSLGDAAPSEPRGSGGASATGGMTGSGGVGGSAGSGGVAGSAGAGGVAGSAGSGGVAGSPGSGGVAGAPGSGGVAGSPGSGGVAGSPGSGGVAGSPGSGGVAGSPGSGGVAGSPGSGGVAGSPGSGGIAGAPGAGGSNSCGDEVVSPGERCDVGISQGQPGACPYSCPRSELCVYRSLIGTGCQAYCEDRRETKSSPIADMCCPTAYPNDMDCPRPYPVVVTAHANGIGDSTSCPCCSKYHYIATPQAYLPLAPTCGVPIMVTADAVPDWTQGIVQRPSLTVAWPFGPTWQLDGNLGTYGRARQMTWIVEPLATMPVFATVRYLDEGCAPGLSVDATFEAQPFVGAPAATGKNATIVRIAGDVVGKFIVIENAPASGPSTVEILAGNDLPFLLGTGTANLVRQASWTQTGAATLSTPSIQAGQPTIAIEPMAPETTATLTPYAHVAWVEGGGTSLLYARVDATGAVTRRKVIQTGAQIATPQIIIFDEQNAGLVWRELAGSTTQVGFAKIPLAVDGAVTPTVLTTSQYGALQPAISSRFTSAKFAAGLVWIENRPGFPRIWFQSLSKDGTPATPEEISPAAVGPSDPVLVPHAEGFRAFWTDRRSGRRSIYTRDNFSGPWYASQELQISGPTSDAHHPRVAPPPPYRSSAGVLVGGGLSTSNTITAVWEVGDTGNRVRLGLVRDLAPLSKVEFLLSCAAATATPDAAMTNTTNQALPAYYNRANWELAAWAEGDKIMVQAINVTPIMQVIGEEW